MMGRKVILTNRAFTLDELEKFMETSWDREQYNEFFVGGLSNIQERQYVLLPATPRYIVLMYSRPAGGQLNKDDKVVLSLTNMPAGMEEKFRKNISSRGSFTNTWKLSMTMSAEKEQSGPAKEALQKYADYMKVLLQVKGYLK